MNQPNQRPSTASPFSTTTLNSSTTIPTQSTPTTMNQGFHEQQHNNGDEENKVHQNQHDQSTDQFINTDAIEKRVWLVKLPKFLAEEWYQQPPNTELGLVRIHNVDTTKQQRHVTLHLQSNTSSKIPKNYTLKFGMDEAHNVHVFTEDPLSGTAISIAGKINHEVNITPIIDDDYKNMIKSRTTDYSQSQRTIKLMDKNEGKNQQFVVPNMMNRTFGFGSMKRQKVIDRKERLPKDIVMNELFQAFAKNEYWSIRGLIELTNQPMLYLKELLVDIAILIKRGPHLGTYQLKQEFKPANTVIKLE